MTPSKKDHVPSTATALSRRLKGRVVAGLIESESGDLTVLFEDGGCLVFGLDPEGPGVVLHDPVQQPGDPDPERWPTRRQQEYLAFIRTYMYRTGVSPAETDIQQHFEVSAPSVNAMVRTLERRGFISRDRDWTGQTVPRSIRVLWDG